MQLKGLEEILTELEGLATRAKQSGYELQHCETLKSLNVPGGNLEECKSALKTLQDELVPVEGRLQRAATSVKWPLKKKKLFESFEIIEGKTRLLVELLNAEHM